MGKRTSNDRTRRRPAVYVGCLVLLFFNWPVQASMRDRAVAELQHMRWLGKDGAPSGLTSLAQTPDGFLWLGTEYGVYRFDGLRFTKADAHTKNRFPPESARALYAAKDGGLWVGFSQGPEVALLRNDTVSIFRSTDAKGIGTVNSIAEDEDGNVWFGAYNGLCMHKPGSDGLRCDGWDGLPARFIKTVYCDRDGTLWVSDGTTLYARRKGTDPFVKMLDGFGWISWVRQAPDGRLWIADPKGPVRVIAFDDGGKPRVDGSISVVSAGLGFDADGTLWISTLGKGIRRVRDPGRVKSAITLDDGSALEPFIQDDGLSGDYAWPILIGREGEVWVGTSAGIDRFQERSLVPANFPKGAHDFALAAGDDGTVWAGTTNHSLMLLKGRELREFKNVPPEVNYAHRAADGTVWIGAASGIYRVENGEPVRVAPLPKPEQVRSILVDREGVVWIVLPVGNLYRWEKGEWTQIPAPPGVPPPARLHAALQDLDGNLWFSYTRGAIVEKRAGQDKVFGANEGLDVGEVRTLYQGRHALWAGGTKGLAFFDGTKFRTVGADAPGELDGVSGIVQLQNGDLWLRSSAGLMHYTAQAVGNASRGQPLRGERFDYLDGLPGQSALISPVPTLVEGTDHRLWLATGVGVVWIDPAHLVRNTLPPPLRIESMTSADQPLPLAGEVTLPAGFDRVQINYTAASLRVPERTAFRYRLDGVDTEWQDAGQRREALYNNLAPGNYHFHVAAANEDSGWNPAAATVEFEVPPLFHQTWAFRALIALAALSLLLLGFYLRMRHVLARVALLHQERIVERERIARDLHDTLLQGVQGLILRFQATSLGMREGDPTRSEIEGTLTRANRILEEGRDKVMGLRSVVECDMQVEQAWSELAMELASLNGPDFKLTTEGTPHELMPLIRDEVHRIGAEAIINAFRHAQATRIEVEVGYAPTELRVRIRDNGRGIPDEVLQAGKRAGHWGLPGMTERATWMRARLAVWSKLGAGTEVELRVPGSVAYGGATPGLFGRLLAHWRHWSTAAKGTA